MLKDIAHFIEVETVVDSAKRICRFLYNHNRWLFYLYKWSYICFLQVHSPLSIFSGFMLWWERRLQGSWFDGMPPGLALFSCSCKVSWISEISLKHGWYLVTGKIMIGDMRKTTNSHMIAWQVGSRGQTKAGSVLFLGQIRLHVFIV